MTPGNRAPIYLLKAASKSGFTRVTSGLRVLPDYIVIGGRRCGTSSLYRYMLEHEAVLQAFPKEVHFFDRNYNYRRGEKWYRAHFPTALTRAMARRRTGSEPVVGETTPSYLYHLHAPRRVAKLLPDVKLIVLLRNPVDHAHSSYWHRVKLGLEKLPTFEDALSAEPERVSGERERMLADDDYDSDNLRRFAYVTSGRYAEHLERWMTFFALDRFFIARSEDLFGDPVRTLRQICHFLGVPEWSLSDYKPYNSLTPVTLNPSTRRKLAEYYVPHNQRLYEMIGRDLGWERLESQVPVADEGGHP